MILDHEPNRSIESFSRLPDFKKLASITIKSCPAKYDRSIIRAAEFLFQDRSKNTPDDDSVEGQSSRRIDSEMIWLLDFNSGLPNIIFRYLHKKNNDDDLNYFDKRWDPEPDLWKRTKDLLEEENSR
ncbi:hypothetical protein BY996DRAFT_6415248 [Phakopsora pachyrhizi]|nr:hypothetical protein BY996DRAFT_6415248 [Phakopsora pachyrhizi]